MCTWTQQWFHWLVQQYTPWLRLARGLSLNPHHLLPFLQCWMGGSYQAKTDAPPLVSYLHTPTDSNRWLLHPAKMMHTRITTVPVKANGNVQNQEAVQYICRLECTHQLVELLSNTWTYRPISKLWCWKLSFLGPIHRYFFVIHSINCSRLHTKKERELGRGTANATH